MSITSALLFSAASFGLVAALASCVHTHHRHASPVVAQMGLKNLRQPRPYILASGQPTQEQLGALSRQGIKHVVNLRPASELDWDEARRVRSLGMNYISIPVGGADDLTEENARRLDHAIGVIGRDPALIHCSSGNRVGALTSMREAIVGKKSARQAVSTGKRWGLTSLEPAVRKKLAGR